MKKVLCVLLAAVLCCGLLGGCNKKEEIDTLPHDDGIRLSDSKEEIIKKEGLKEENENGGVISGYPKSEKVKILDTEFECLYQFSDRDCIGTLRYLAPYNDELYQKIKNLFNEKYGKEIDDFDISWDKPCAWEITNDDIVWEIQMGVIENFNGYVGEQIIITISPNFSK